jgi:hypothetical protein
MIEHMQEQYEMGDTPKKGALIFLDFEKAFDRVDHDFMFMVLSKMGYPPQFTNWVKLLYSGATATVRVNNVDSNKFDIHSGVKQGCPLSPLLFACVVETMANLLRNCEAIEGIVSPRGRMTKLSQCADDTTLTLQNVLESLPAALEMIEIFCQVSCMKLNVDKTEGMLLGVDSNVPRCGDMINNILKLKVKWCARDGLLRSLGTQLTIGGDTQTFWDSKLRAILNRLNNWRSLTPTMMGKNLIAKLSLHSCIWYYCQNMLVPHNFKVSLNRIIDTFLWKNYKGFQPVDKKCRSLNGRNNMAQTYKQCGLKTSHLDSAKSKHLPLDGLLD